MSTNHSMDAALEMTSPRRKGKLAETIQSMANLNSNIENMELPMDPDAQATITDFLDFTEYLPSDLVRSMALISDLDEKYVNASLNVNDFTRTYGHLPDLPADSKPDPVSLRKDISTSLTDALCARTLAFAEASHMVENVERHFKRAQNILAKLEAMAENYPETREPSPLPQKSNSPVANRAPGKLLLRAGNSDGRMRVRRRRAPIITVPGEVMAPYELDYESYDSYSDDSESDVGLPTPRRHTPARSVSVNPKIKLKVKPPKKEKVPKTPRAPRPPGVMGTNVHSAVAGISTSNALAKLQPPPPDAKAGSEDAPWLQLTAWELAKLRKRMKKNAPFDQPVPPQLTGKTVIAEGAISAEALGAEEIQLSNRGMKLNEAKKLKREAAAKELAKLAAEEAEESVRKMTEAASTVKSLFGNHPEDEKKEKEKEKATTKTPKKQVSRKRKRESTIEDVKANGESSSIVDGIADTNEIQGDRVNEADSSKLGKPQFKRTKTETPVPPPHPIITNATPRATPVPTLESAVSVASSIALSAANTDTPTGSTPIVPVSATSPPKSSTPILPPGVEKKEAKKEARKAAAVAKKEAKEAAKAVADAEKAERNEEKKSEKPEKTTNTRITRKATPVASSMEPTTSATESLPSKRPTSSRGKAAAAKEAASAAIKSEDPVSAAPTPAALDRPRRTSTARNTPAPETRQPSKRAKRPAPGVVTVSTEGGSTAVSVGKRRAAPRKKAGQKKEKKDGREGSAVQEVLDEVDDDGNLIDPNEPRYCTCNRVSFGTMIACENDNCEKEWFHLECVGLPAIPPRTTKWYCPDCRIILGIGEKGEVNARGRKK
ncbi:88e8d916-10c3-4a44-b97c-7da40dd23015 [Sclerotinia trifoliorum]|uniref:88e8d916-10c3-4a44-b97c-7da40dd23015 n=1 Tax=Sclerotinia trifoliorum TaxID=28548 RepID=A0A8H2VQP0_9HELO|nr:88e8d916-10c3-4a44-b97c-7da40dd23015 [Sclerotinia trifoliorum]